MYSYCMYILTYEPGICLAQPMVLTNSLSYSSARVCTTIEAATVGDDDADADDEDDDDDDGEDVDDIPSSTRLPPMITAVPVPCCAPSVEDCVKNSIVIAALVDPSPPPNKVGISGSHCLSASNIFSKKTKRSKFMINYY